MDEELLVNSCAIIGEWIFFIGVWFFFIGEWNILLEGG